MKQVYFSLLLILGLQWLASAQNSCNQFNNSNFETVNCTGCGPVTGLTLNQCVPGWYGNPNQNNSDILMNASCSGGSFNLPFEPVCMGNYSLRVENGSGEYKIFVYTDNPFYGQNNGGIPQVIQLYVNFLSSLEPNPVGYPKLVVSGANNIDYNTVPLGAISPTAYDECNVRQIVLDAEVSEYPYLMFGLDNDSRYYSIILDNITNLCDLFDVTTTNCGQTIEVTLPAEFDSLVSEYILEDVEIRNSNGEVVLTLDNPSPFTGPYTVNLPPGDYTFHATVLGIYNTGESFFFDLVYHFTIDECCVLGQNGTVANFDLKTTCNNGQYSVTPTPLSTGPGIQHSWILMQTTTPGATTGGTQVGTVQFGNSPSFSGLQSSNFYYIIHKVTVGYCEFSTTQVVPYHEIASIFNLEDETGVTKTEFCHGEDIYLDGTATYGENAYKIYKSRRPIGSTQNFAQFHESPWFTNTQAGLINMSEVFANQNNYFEPGYEYKITLAVQNVAACVNWIIAVDTISVVCCEDSISAKFGYQLTQNNVIRVEEANFDTYENINATHTWTILSGPTVNGPYTYLTTFSGTSFDYAAAPGLYYFVIHSVKTECGEVCYGNPVPVSKSAGDSDGICELCGIIDCDFLSKICQAPTELKGKCLSDPFNPGVIQQLLTWASVANATQYQVEVVFNSNRCCRSTNPSVTYTYTVNTNSLDLNTVVVPLGWDCLSWRVGAVCNGEETVWSEYQCFEGCKTGERTDGQQYQSPTATLTPNPATNEVTLRFETDFTGSLQLIDAFGRTVASRQETTTRTVQFNLEQVSPGIYWIIARDENGVQPFKLIKK